MSAGPTANEYDVLVIGAGVGGMESALTLGDMGFKVLVVEKEPSVGGRMILLSKVFPTLDCASCISTPKMAAVNGHPNVRTLVYSEVDDITPRPEGGFVVHVTRKPTFIDPQKCTGCYLCEAACTVALPDEFNYDLAARRAAHIAFPQAVPKKAVITRRGSSPCSFSCPAGVKPHGYISLVRAGKYDQAFRQHLDDAPLVGVLSRACYAPCEEACSRKELEGPLSIRGIKRFMADRYYASHSSPEYGPPLHRQGKRIAIVGSGPSGLAAAFVLGRSGYDVTVFESDREPGGILRWGIPSYRLPKDVVARDLANVTALGVRIEPNHRITSLAELRLQGFDAVYLATGDRGGRKLQVPGEDLPGVHDAVEYLHDINAGQPPDFSGKTVIVIGGGNVAIDSARSAVRLGARAVKLFCLESRPEMPAHPWEIREAEEEGVLITNSWGVGQILGSAGRTAGVELIRCTSVFDTEHRFRPTFDATTHETVAGDVVITAIGLAPNTEVFGAELERQRNGTIQVDPTTLATSLPGVFAGGDAVTGPSMIVTAIGQGKRAAFHIDRFLRGEPLATVPFDDRLPTVDAVRVATDARANTTPRPPVTIPRTPAPARVTSFVPYEQPLSEEEARTSANRCLDCGVCCECRECVRVCPAFAIDLDMRARHERAIVRSVALATGFSPFDAKQKPALGFGRLANVISGPQMDRILAPTRPFNAVVRPSDGKVPVNVAFVLCVGSRDDQVGNRLCSRVCCMYSLKQAQLLMGSVPLADVTIYYIDIRAFSKGYEEFFQQTKGMSVYFQKGRVSRIEETENQDLLVHYEDIEGGGGQKTARHDLVVLATGLLPNQGAFALFPTAKLAQDEFSYVREVNEELEPGATNLEGVYVVGSATAVRDIPDTIVHSAAASAQIAAFLKREGAKA
ncbi:MAG TPA: FAD-dependent oxidoreductase [Thermoplasmata archaeon]|jgi:heterodisulfide reductase subunit A|nr:FAD-dependent oxidoreductase [Thermoplasmata archaeon]